MARVAIYVVTYRRPELLRRALHSLAKQTFTNWVGRVVNDDPSDARVQAVISGIGDPRIQLFRPMEKRGAATNFNLAFQERECEYASILEDDNWWHPTFLSTMIRALNGSPRVELACSNEVVYKQNSDGEWHDTGTAIWTETSERLYSTPVETACGSAKLCNSSMLFRTARAARWQTPNDIPVDVTEHFRERVIEQPIRLVGEPLVNYGETWTTNRSTAGTLWGEYQCILIASCFISVPSDQREMLAKKLWNTVGPLPSPRATSLLMAARAVPEARVLWTTSSPNQRRRFWLTSVRRFKQTATILQAPTLRGQHLKFLTCSPYNRRLASAVS